MLTRRHFVGTFIAGSMAHAVGAESRIRIGQIGTQHAHASGKMEAVRRLSDLYDVVGVASDAATLGPVYAGIPRLQEAELHLT